MQPILQIATATSVGVGAPLLLLMVVGIFANSQAAEQLAWKQIRKECERQGYTDVEPFTSSRSSYGVQYRIGGKKYRGKCAVGLFSGKVHWDRNNPATVDGDPRG